MDQLIRIVACLFVLTAVVVAADDGQAASDTAAEAPETSGTQREAAEPTQDAADAPTSDAAEPSVESESSAEPAASDGAAGDAEADVAEAPPVDPKRVASLIAQLSATDYQAREQATEALRAIGEPARAALQAVAAGDDAEASMRARSVLRTIRARELRKNVGADDRELHIVGCYEGGYPPGVTHGGGNHPEGSVTITVDRPGKAVTLVLTAYEPVRWQLEPTEGTFIERVVLSGYHRQALAALPEGCKVEQLRGGQRSLFAYKKDQRYNQLVEAVKNQIDLPIASFHGSYKLDGEPVTIRGK